MSSDYRKVMPNFQVDRVKYIQHFLPRLPGSVGDSSIVIPECATSVCVRLLRMYTRRSAIKYISFITAQAGWENPGRKAVLRASGRGLKWGERGWQFETICNTFPAVLSICALGLICNSIDTFIFVPTVCLLVNALFSARSCTGCTRSFC